MGLSIDAEVVFKVWREVEGQNYNTQRRLCFKHAVQAALKNENVETEVETAGHGYYGSRCEECPTW